MFGSSRRAGIAVALFAGATSGCTDVTTPAPPAVGTYVLRTVEGESLPTVLRLGDIVIERVLADTITLFEDGSARQHQVSTFTYPADASDQVHESDSELILTWSSSGGRVVLNYLCPPDVISSCIAPPHMEGRFVPEGMRLDRVLGARAPLAYEQIHLPAP